MTVSSVYSALLFSVLLHIFHFNAISLFNHCRKQNKEIQRLNIRFRQQLPVPIFNACPYGNNYNAAHCFLLNDLIIRAICFLKNDISDLSSIIPIVQAVYFIIFSAVKPAILLPTLLYRRFVGIFGYLLQFSAVCFTWNNTYLGQILLYRS